MLCNIFLLCQFPLSGLCHYVDKNIVVSSDNFTGINGVIPFMYNCRLVKSTIVIASPVRTFKFRSD